MPNYSLVIDATYDPLSFQEISAPIKEAAAYHQALQDSYDKMQLASAMYAPYVKDDPVAKEMYDRYMGRLNNAADVLASHGAWGQRDMLSQARESYGVDMMPIELGFKKRESEAQIQAQGRLKGLEFSRDARTSPISYYFDHPEGGYEIADPAVLTNMVATQMKAYADQLRSLNPEQQAIFAAQTGLPESLIATVVQYGIPAEAAINWRNYDFMRAIMRTALGSKGMTMDDNGFGVGNETWSKDVTDRLINSMASGFAAGAGKDQVQIMQSPEWAFQAEMAKQQAALAANSGVMGNPFDDYYVDFDALDDSVTNEDRIGELVGEAEEFLGKGYKASRASNREMNYNKDTHQFTWDAPKDSEEIFFTKNGKARSKDEFYSHMTSHYGRRGSYTYPMDSYQGNDPNPVRLTASGKNNLWGRYSRFMIKNGFTYDETTGRFMNGDREATYADVRNAVNQNIRDNFASTHYLANTGLSYESLNASARGLQAFEFEKYNKDGSYKKMSDNPVTLSELVTLENIKDAKLLVDAVPGSKEGLVLKVPVTGDKKKKFRYYHIPTSYMGDMTSIRQTFEAYKEAVKSRRDKQRELGLSDAEWNARKQFNDETIAIYDGAVHYALKALMKQLGSGNTVSSSSI